MPDRNGSGNAPTTARTSAEALQSWWSHQTSSPARELVRGGAVLGQDPVDVVEPVDRPAVLATARDAVDLLHEAAAVAGLDVEVALQHPHHRLAARDRVGRAGADLARAEVARDGERRAALLALARAQAAAAREDGRGEERATRGGAAHQPTVDPHGERDDHARACSACSRYVPAAGAVSVATPSAPVSAVGVAEAHQRALDGHARAGVVIAADRDAQRPPGGDPRCAAGVTSSVRWQESAASLTHQNHSTRWPARSRRPVPNEPAGSAAPALPARRPTL